MGSTDESISTNKVQKGVDYRPAGFNYIFDYKCIITMAAIGIDMYQRLPSP